MWYTFRKEYMSWDVTLANEWSERVESADGTSDWSEWASERMRRLDRASRDGNCNRTRDDDQDDIS